MRSTPPPNNHFVDTRNLTSAQQNKNAADEMHREYSICTYNICNKCTYEVIYLLAIGGLTLTQRMLAPNNDE
jgi:hypothetical protein